MTMDRANADVIMQSIIRDRNLYSKFCNKLLDSAVKEIIDELKTVTTDFEINIITPIIVVEFCCNITKEIFWRFLNAKRKVEEKYKLVVVDMTIKK